MLDLPVGPSMRVSFFGGPFRTVVVSLTMLRLVASVFFCCRKLTSRFCPSSGCHLKHLPTRSHKCILLPTFSPSILAPKVFEKAIVLTVQVPKIPFQGSHAPSFLVGRLRPLGQLVRQHDWRLGRWGGATEIPGISSQPNISIVGFQPLIFRGVLYKIGCSDKKHASMVIWRANCETSYLVMVMWGVWWHESQYLPCHQNIPDNISHHHLGNHFLKAHLHLDTVAEGFQWRDVSWSPLGCTNDADGADNSSIGDDFCCSLPFIGLMPAMWYSISVQRYQVRSGELCWSCISCMNYDIFCTDFLRIIPKTSWRNVFSKSTG